MRKQILMVSAAAVALGWCGSASAQDGGPITLQAKKGTDGILVNADRDPEEIFIEDFTGSATIITPDQIEQRQVRNVEDVLRDVPGVAVSSVAGQTQIRLRGTEANHVLVLVDGIEVSDPGSGEFDFGTLQAEIGSRVEVLRGPQSALYGNDAIGGVIAYESGRFEGIGTFVEAGTNDTINGAARLGIDENGVAASLSATIVSTDGEPNARFGTRDIGRDSYTLAGKIEAQTTDALQLRAVGRYVETEGESNDQDFAFGSPSLGLVIDSPGVGFDSEAFYGLVGARLSTFDDSWTHDLSVQYADIRRNTFAPFGLTSDSESDRFKASYVSAFQFGDRKHSLTFAADYEQEGFNNVATFDDRRETENVGLVGEYRFNGDGFDVSAALRQDFNNRFQDTTTFRVGAGFDVTDTTRIRAAVGTGVKNPSFFELFGFFDGVFIGNPELEPEESTSWEVGLDQGFFGGDAQISVTYFNAELDSEIFTVFPAPTFIATPGNRTTESEQQGIEVALSAQISEQWSLNAAYTYLDAEEDGVTEVRRPESIASGAITWTHPGDTASATLVVRHNGEMLDSDFTAGFPAGIATLDDFTLVNINARVELSDGIDLFGRVENLLDERYEQVLSFVSPGLTAIAGIRAQF